MTLEDLGYKRVEEEEYLSQFIMRYEKDITRYEIDGHKAPRDKLEYRCKTIFISKKGVICLVGISLDSFEFAREHSILNPTLAAYCFQMVESLTFEEMEAILEMKEKGEFSKLKQGGEINGQQDYNK